jgi:DNA-binding transcriptional regulator YiaG
MQGVEKRNIQSKIKLCKKKLNITWPVMARRLDVSFDSLKNWYMGRFKPDADSMKKLDKLFLEVGI